MDSPGSAAEYGPERPRRSASTTERHRIGQVFLQTEVLGSENSLSTALPIDLDSAAANRVSTRSAKVALARKLAVVLHRMLADGTSLLADKAAAAVTR